MCVCEGVCVYVSVCEFPKMEYIYKAEKKDAYRQMFVKQPAYEEVLACKRDEKTKQKNKAKPR